MFPIKCRFPPTLVNSPRTGIRYVIGDGKWVEVPPETTREDMSKWFTWEPYKAQEDATAGSWQVVGSTGTKYTVKRAKGAYSCSCPGFGWRRKCKHVEQIKTKVEAG